MPYLLQILWCSWKKKCESSEKFKDYLDFLKKIIYCKFSSERIKSHNNFYYIVVKTKTSELRFERNCGVIKMCTPNSLTPFVSGYTRIVQGKNAALLLGISGHVESVRGNTGHAVSI